MKSSSSRAFILSLCAGFAVASPAAAQVAGTVNLTSQTQGDLKLVAVGYRASKILHSAVYNVDGSHIGDVNDIIVTPNTYVSYVIVAVGGFLKIGQKDVAIPAKDFNIQNDKLVLVGGTKKALESLPAFHYSKL